jgi:uncharacterized protein
MKFLLKLVAANGREAEGSYDTANSSLVIEGQPVEVAQPPRASKPAQVLKIQMGLACNMACSYCLQTPHSEEKTSTANVETFLAEMATWWLPDPNLDLRIEFWGGEPFLHWAKLKRLVSVLRLWHLMATLVIITNGTLLNQERAEWVKANDISLGISHDGPGQMGMRHEDPLDRPEARAAILWLIEHHPGKVGFNSVLTLPNHRLSAIRDHLVAALGREDFGVGTEGLVHVEGVLSAFLSPLTDEDHAKVRLSLLSEIIDGSALTNGSITREIEDFVKSVASGRRLAGLGQGCGMDRPDHVAVDLKGNVLTCQNTPNLPLGHVSNLAEAQVVVPFREGCQVCPVVHLCKMGCLYLEGDNWTKSCANKLTFHSAILAGAVYLLTGWVISEMTPS